MEFDLFFVCIDIDKIKVGIGMHVFFRKFAAELWPLLDVDWDLYAHLAFLQHRKH